MFYHKRAAVGKLAAKAAALLLIIGLAAAANAPSAGSSGDAAGAAVESVAETGSEEPAADTELKVHFIDVGQGDCTLIECDGSYMLIDAGNNDQGTAVWSYLRNQGVQTLDYVIGTHPDADHIGGMDVVLYKFDCKTIILPEVSNDTAAYDAVIRTMEDKGYTALAPVVGETYALGGASFTIIAPNRDYGEELNDWSVGILLQNGENRFLFLGDAGEAAEEDILANGIPIAADVYKVAHHGSKTSTTQAFLDAVNPSYAVISVGAGNSYGHPSAEVLNRLRSAGIQVFRTDEQGTIVAMSDGTAISWNCTPSETWQAGEPEGTAEPQENEASGDADVIVHITATGKKYHSDGCVYLEKSDYEVTLEEAESRGFTPCAKCNPPQ